MWAGGQYERERDDLASILTQKLFALAGNGVSEFRRFAQLLRLRWRERGDECKRKRAQREHFVHVDTFSQCKGVLFL